MQDELTALIGEAGAVRSRLPGQLEPDVVRLQRQMDILSERLAGLRADAAAMDAGEETSTRAPQSTPVETAPEHKDLGTRGGAADTPRAPYENPWDAQSADALMQLYESEEGGLGGAGTATRASVSAAVERGEAPQRPNAKQNSESQASARNSLRLDERFAEVARSIEESLTDVKPESSLSGLEHRFEHLEELVGSALKSLAIRADARELRNVEAQIVEISAKLVEIRSQLARLDNVDAQLSVLTKQLSDERLAGMISEAQIKAVDLQGMATNAAMEAASSVADKVSGEAHLRELGEVRSLVERHISERRAHDANTVGMLETMQQTIVRVIERIDTSELSARQEDGAKPVPQEQEHAASFDPESVEGALTVDAVARHLAAAEKAEAARGPTYEVPHYMPISPGETPDTALTDDTSFESEVIFGSEYEIASQINASPSPPPLPGTLEALRRDLVANAQQAREQAAGEMDSSGEQAGAISMGETEKPPANKRKAGRLSARPSKSRRRLLFFVAVVFLLMPSATLLALKMPPNWKLDGVSYSRFTTMVESLISSETGSAGVSQIPQIKAPHRKRPETPVESKSVMGTGNGSSSIVMPGMVVSGGSPVSVIAEPVSASQDDAMPVVLMPEQGLSTGGDQQSATAAQARSSSAYALPPPDVGSRTLRDAAARGDPSAQFEVAARLARGQGNLHDLEAAARWFERSAASGFAMAQYRLATLYHKGLGVSRDLDRAKVWYRRAAEQGNVKAMHNLAVLLAGGDSHKPDYSTAAQWFLEAAERGLPDSQYNLAILCETGFGVAKDTKQAYKWLVLAAKAGDEEASRRRDAMTLALSTEDRAAAERLVRGWKAKPSDPLINDAHVAGRAWHPVAVPG